MRERIPKKAAFGLLVGSVLIALAACAVSGGSDGETAAEAGVTFVFVDGYTGQPVSGVVVVIGGEEKVSDSDGRLETGVQAGGLLEGYFDPGTLSTLGYGLYATEYFIPNCFSFVAPAGFVKTFLLAPVNQPPAQATISGTAYQKGGGRPTISSGSVLVYSAAGFELNGTGITDGAYSVDLPLGTFTFVVCDGSTSICYYAVVPVTGTATVDLSYDGASDITLTGNPGGATDVHAALKLGERLIDLAAASVQLDFTVVVPHLGQDVIRLYSEKRPDAFYRYVLAQDLTQDRSGLSLAFATGSTVPLPWAHNVAWDDGTRTLSWSPAGNAVYVIAFLVGRSQITAMVQGASFTVPAAFDISSFSSVRVIPVWADGPLADLVPEPLAASTVIWYDDRAAVLGGGGGKGK